MEIAKSGLREF